MHGCSDRYHETFSLTDSIDIEFIDPPKVPVRSFRAGIDELATSIRQCGLIQPIIVRPNADRFEVVAGARRLEAVKRLRWSRVPCIIRDLTEQGSFEISLIENIQRKTMNVMEEAEAFRRYIKQCGWGGETQLAAKIGKSQEYISHRLSLLNLPKKVQDEIIRGRIKPSVALEISSIGDPSLQELLSDEAIRSSLTVDVVRSAAKSINETNGNTSLMEIVNLESQGRLNEGRTEVRKLKTDVLSVREEDFTEPDFARVPSNKGKLQRQTDDAIKDLENAIITLRLCLARLGRLIDNLPEDSLVKDVLLEKRLTIHNLIDALIATKTKVTRV